MRLKQSYLTAFGLSLMLILGACQHDLDEQQDNQKPAQEDNEDGADADKIEEIFKGGE